jgi:hypothetical protein
MMNNADLSVNGQLAANQSRRERRQALVTPRDSYADGRDAMSEIFERKRMRGDQFRELKMSDFRDRMGLTFDEAREMNFADKEYRLAIKEGKMKGAFAGEGMSFPIASPEDVRRAWQSVGRSDQPTEKLQRNILRIARKYGWESGLPKAVRDRIKKGGSGLPTSDHAEVEYPGRMKAKRFGEEWKDHL